MLTLRTYQETWFNVSGAPVRVDVFVKVENLNEPIEPQRLFVILKKDGDKKWRVATVETPDNQQPKDADDETEH